MTESDVRKLVEDYLSEAIQIDTIEGRLLDLEPSEETELSKRLVGLFAEASHAHWEEDEVREELINAIRPILSNSNSATNGDLSSFPIAESNADSFVNVAA
jgi:hypothetical protein